MMKNKKRAWLWLSPSLAMCLGACPSTDNPEADVHNPPPKSFRVLVSGEEMLAEGIPFAHGSHSIAFEDGWKLSFESAIVTLAKVQLSENPDMSSGDQARTGEVVAELEGPFAVELKSEGGFGLEGLAHALGVLSKQNKKKGSPAFDSQTRYAFGYSLVRATPEAVKIGFGEDTQRDYESMQAQGYSVFVRAKAWREEGETCRASASYDFGRLPSSLEFELGFNMPVSYKNCENPAIGGLRGVQVKDNASVDAVIALHFDHLFWEALQEDAKLRLDAWIAHKSVETGPAPHAKLSNADLEKIDYLAVQDAQKRGLPYRYCGEAQEDEKKSGEMLRYEPGSEAGGLQHLHDFIQYNLSTFGHLNENGLCFPQREY
ncbi:MAG: hypothetical protein FWG75_08870 [Cystobacterineae bacterium]|nr:hypothetical protein [Cystobacterineae bacterium]